MSNTGLPAALQAAELWPIYAKGAVQRLNPLGDPSIEQFYHQAMEQGRFLERNIADAQHWLAQKQQELMRQILTHTRLNSLAVNGQLSNPARAIKYVVDSGTIIKDISGFQSEIIGLINAVTQNIAILEMVESNMLSVVSGNLNALANILQQICNWQLPTLASLPNLLGDTIWYWNGVQFAPLSSFEQLLAKIGSLGAVSNLSSLGSSLSSSIGSTVSSLSSIPSQLSQFSFSNCVLLNPTSPSVTSPPSTTSPPAASPSTIPSSVTTPSGLTLGTTLIAPPLNGAISPTGQNLADSTFVSLMQSTTTPPTYLSPADPVYNEATPFNVNNSMLGSVPNPTTIISNYQMPPATYQANIVCVVPQTRSVTDASDLQNALVEYVNLGQIVASNFDPNLTAEWLFYLSLNRTGRAGTWLTNFQAAYTALIAPSLAYLADNPVPWNCVLPSTAVNDAPTAIPLLTTLTTASAPIQGNILWMLSYIEASLLGYTRNTTWDAFASVDYVSSFTGTDLDYQATTINTAVTTTVILGETTAEYPVSCTFPSAIGDVLQQVIAIASVNIQNTPGYTTNRPQFMYVFNQFAVATAVDRFSQFWRTFNANLQTLLLQDAYLVQFVVTYSGSLDSAIDPLGTSAIYDQMQVDAATRNRSWVPGSVLPPIPAVPNVSYTTTSGATNQNGWTGAVFDPAAYLSRPDIQQLPIPTQLAMLRTNLSYAATLQSASAASSAIQNSIQTSQSIIQSFQNVGFEVEVATVVNVVPPGALGLQVSFDQIDYDYTGNVTSPSMFTIQTAGNYAVIILLNWGAGAAGVRTGTVLSNGTTVLATSSTSGTQTAPTMIQVSLTAYFNVGDVMTVVATHDLAAAQTLTSGSSVTATLTDTTAPSPATSGVPSNTGTSSTRTFTADSTIAPLTALAVGTDGNVSAIDPTTVQTDGMGDPIYPIVTGVSLSSASAGDSVTVGTYYGGVYEYDGANFTVGGLLYAGVGGVLTQDYATIVATCQWIVVVGRAISPDQFIYEPHLPNLSNLGTF